MSLFATYESEVQELVQSANAVMASVDSGATTPNDGSFLPSFVLFLSRFGGRVRMLMCSSHRGQARSGSAEGGGGKLGRNGYGSKERHG